MKWRGLERTLVTVFTTINFLRRNFTTIANLYSRMKTYDIPAGFEIRKKKFDRENFWEESEPWIFHRQKGFPFSLRISFEITTVFDVNHNFFIFYLASLKRWNKWRDKINKFACKLFMFKIMFRMLKRPNEANPEC